MKRGLTWIVCALLAACALSLCSCNTLSELQNAVRYPDTYTLSYEVTDSEGTVTTVTKTVDANGNVYYKDAVKIALVRKCGSRCHLHDCRYFGCLGAWSDRQSDFEKASLV